MNRLLLVMFIFTFQAVAADCKLETRITVYKELRADLEQMYDLMPAQKPSEREFYKEVDDNLYTKPEKYKGFLGDRGYVIYSNTTVLTNHLFWVNQAIDALTSKNKNLEIHAFSRLMIGGVKDVYWLSGISDSNYLFQNGITSKKYADLGKHISLKYGSIALCMAQHYESLL
ncbi:hypothetical protein [Marisediminitalea sp.]|uniref:hypothetical protein n=1 Tax=Marisediminitalea sp. TaxID=2662268 RepID=UPI003512CF6A